MQPKKRNHLYAALFLFSACGAPEEVETPLFTPRAQDEGTLRLAEDLSIEALYDLALEKDFNFDSEDLTRKEIIVDELSMAHVRSRQFVKGIPVLGGESIVHLDKMGRVSSITDNLVKGIKSDFDVEPALSSSEALRVVLDRYDCVGCFAASSEADLWVVEHRGVARLAYRVQLERIDGEAPEAPVIYLDANTGEELLRDSNIKTAWGSTHYNGDVEVGTHYYPNNYYWTTIEGTYTNNWYVMEDWYWGTQVMDMSGFGSSNHDANDYWNAEPQKSVNSVQYGARKTLEYFLNYHNRSGIDNNWGPRGYNSAWDGETDLMVLGAHDLSTPNNAGWYTLGNRYSPIARFGDGDGVNYGSFASLDTVGHELTHGVVEHSAALLYSGESGALNESFSDIFGAQVQRFATGNTSGVWRQGEDYATPNNGTGDAERYLDNPRLNNYPSHFSLFQNGTDDHGRVHFNSSIPNHVFYLVAKGGHQMLTAGFIWFGIGDDAAAAIWYRALTLYLSPTSDFYAARAATIRAAEDLYGVGSFQASVVSQAWALCGVGINASINGITGGDLESDGYLWSVAGDARMMYSFSPSYARSGQMNMNLGGNNSTTGTITRTITIPAGLTRSTLTFMMKVTTQESPTTTTPYDTLSVKILNTNDQLLSTQAVYSNLSTLDGTYRSRGIFDLSPYIGQTVKLQFATQSDFSLPTQFDIDDIAVTNSTTNQFANNGGFESGYLQWVFTNAAYAQSVFFAQPRTGSGNLMLGNCNSCVGSVVQSLNLPTQSAHSLSFWAKVSTSETYGEYDNVFVELVAPNGAVILLGNIANNDPTSYTQYQFPVNYVGWLQIRFRLENDSTLPTSFYIDDIQLQ